MTSTTLVERWGRCGEAAVGFAVRAGGRLGLALAMLALNEPPATGGRALSC